METELSSTEAKVKDVWMQILSINEISADQTFFDLGGDSLSMIDMLEQINCIFGIEVNPGSIFEDASLLGFSKHVDSARNSNADAERGTI